MSIHAVTDAADLASEELAELVADIPAFPSDGQLVPTLVWMRESVRVLRQAPPADAIAEHLVPHADLHAFTSMWHPVLYMGPVAYHLAVLASVARRYSEAEKLFERALEMCHSFGATGALWRTEVEYGRMLLERGGTGDRESALQRLRRGVRGLRAVRPDTSGVRGDRTARDGGSAASRCRLQRGDTVARGRSPGFLPVARGGVLGVRLRREASAAEGIQRSPLPRRAARVAGGEFHASTSSRLSTA